MVSDAAEGRDAGLRNVPQVVGRQRAELSRESRTAVVRQLVGMNAAGEAVLTGGAEDPAHLQFGIRGWIVEDVDRRREAFACRDRDHLGADPIDVRLDVGAGVGRSEMRRQCGGDDAESGSGRQRREDAQVADLLVDRQAVARLDLRRRRAETRETLEPEEHEPRRALRPTLRASPGRCPSRRHRS